MRLRQPTCEVAATMEDDWRMGYHLSSSKLKCMANYDYDWRTCCQSGKGATNQLPSSENLCKVVANCWRLYKRGLHIPETIYEYNFLGYALCDSWIIFKKLKNFYFWKS